MKRVNLDATNKLFILMSIIIFLTISNMAFSQSGKAYIYNNLGSSRMDRNDFEGAIRYFGLALEIDPNYYPSYMGRGLAYSKIGDYRKALKDYDKAILLIPAKTQISKETLADCLFGRGVLKQNLSDFNGAIADYTKCLIIKPYDKDSYLNRGYAFANIKKMNDACSDWKKALSLGNKEASDPLRQFCKNLP